MGLGERFTIVSNETMEVPIPLLTEYFLALIRLVQINFIIFKKLSSDFSTILVIWKLSRYVLNVPNISLLVLSYY